MIITWSRRTVQTIKGSYCFADSWAAPILFFSPADGHQMIVDTVVVSHLSRTGTTYTLILFIFFVVLAKQLISLVHSCTNMNINIHVRIYLWLWSFPGMRSPVWSMGEGSRLRQEVNDWLESSLETVHTHRYTQKICQVDFIATLDTFKCICERNLTRKIHYFAHEKTITLRICSLSLSQKNEIRDIKHQSCTK